MIVIVQFLRKHRKKWKQISGQTTQYDWHYAQNDRVSTVASKDLTGFQPKTDTGTVYCTIVIKNAIVVTVVMFLHLSVSHSVHRGDVCQTPPPEQTPPCANSPLGRHPPPRQTPPGRPPPPPIPQQTATAANGTHPTGMHSCWSIVSEERRLQYHCRCQWLCQRNSIRRTVGWYTGQGSQTMMSTKMWGKLGGNNFFNSLVIN